MLREIPHHRFCDRTKIWWRLPVNQSCSYEKVKPPMEKLTKLHTTHFVEQAISANKQHLRLPTLNLQKVSLFLVKALMNSARLVDMMTKYHGRCQSEAQPVNQLVYSLAQDVYTHTYYFKISQPTTKTCRMVLKSVGWSKLLTWRWWCWRSIQLLMDFPLDRSKRSSQQAQGAGDSSLPRPSKLHKL